MEYENLKIIVIIPCYNEQDNIVSVVQRLKEENPTVDYIVVNDCSTDNSEKVMRENAIKYISNPYNLGIGGTVQCGYRYAVAKDYDIAVQMDGDGQHSPCFLRTVTADIESGKADMCIGSRFLTREGFQSSFARRMGISLISTTIKILTGKRIKDTTSGYRATGKKMTAFFANEYAQDFPEPEAILSSLKCGFTVTEVPVIMEERGGGVSSINTVKSVYYMIKVLLSLVVSWLKY